MQVSPVLWWVRLATQRSRLESWCSGCSLQGAIQALGTGSYSWHLVWWHWPSWVGWPLRSTHQPCLCCLGLPCLLDDLWLVHLWLAAGSVAIRERCSGRSGCLFELTLLQEFAKVSIQRRCHRCDWQGQVSARQASCRDFDRAKCWLDDALKHALSAGDTQHLMGQDYSDSTGSDLFIHFHSSERASKAQSPCRPRPCRIDES